MFNKGDRKYLYSIITVCKNSFPDIVKTIESVKKQNFKDYEYIVIDGDSTDGTREILNKYKDHINVLVSEKDDGIYSAMNKGILLSNGKYLLFLNSGDCLVGPSVLSNISKLGKNKDIIVGRIISDNYFIKPAWGQRINKYYLFANTFPHQASFIKRDLFTKAGMYKESFFIRGDHDFFMRAVVKFNCTYVLVDQIVSYFKPGGISQRAKSLSLMYKEVGLSRKDNYSLLRYAYYHLRYNLNLIFKECLVKPIRKFVSKTSGLSQK